MQDYVSQILGVFNKKESQVMNESVHTDSMEEILENLKQLKYDFQKKVMDPARGMLVTPDPGFIAGGDKANPHVLAVYRVEAALRHLEDQLRAQLSDPLREDETGADAPLSSSDATTDISASVDNSNLDSDVNLEGEFESSRVERNENSYYYYKGMHPEMTDDLMQINGWTYSGNEIWDDAGVCSIIYDPEADSIFVFELMDPDGIEQELVTKLDSVDELDSALTNFVELEEVAPKMRNAFAEYIENQRSSLTEEAGTEIAPSVAPEPLIIDEWEYVDADPEWNDNATLLYDKSTIVVFIQKDRDPEAGSQFMVTTLKDGIEDEKEFDDIDSLYEWLSINELPVPTKEAKEAFLGYAVESKEEKDCPELPKDFKCTEDDPEIARLAAEVPEPEVAEVDKENK